MRAGVWATATEFSKQRGAEHLVDEGALSRTRDTGHRDEKSERHFDVDPAQVVVSRFENRQLARIALPTLVPRDPLSIKMARDGRFWIAGCSDAFLRSCETELESADGFGDDR